MSVATATRYVVVCRGPSCRERGGLALRKRLVALIKREPDARLLGYSCFGQCDYGPNVVFFPEGTWRGGLSASDAEALIAHAVRGTQAPGAHLEPPDAQEHLANVAELVATVERDTAKRARWWWPF